VWTLHCVLLLDGQGRAKIADFGISRYEARYFYVEIFLCSGPS
jgi:hypothetical protein